MKHKRGIVNFIINSIITILLIIVSFALVMLIVIYAKTDKNTMEISDFWGYKPTICISNSMQNEFEVGDIIISKQVSENSINVGDIITYREAETLVTHRIEDIVYEKGERKYLTKGDSNNSADEKLVSYEEIEGTYVYKIPKIGNIILMLQKPQGFFMVFFIPVVLLALTYKMILNRNKVKELRKKKLLKRLQEKELMTIK